jgi:predicted PurR-regulated permease PerM
MVVLRPFLSAILAAAIVCFSTWPVYRFIERRLGGRRGLAAFCMTLLILIVLVVPLALIALSFRDHVPRLAEDLRERMEHGMPKPPAWVPGIPIVGGQIDAAWRELAESPAKLAEALKESLLPAREILVEAGLLIAEGVLQFTLIAFVGFFLYRDGAVLVEVLRHAMNRVTGNLTERLLGIVGDTIEAVIYGIVGTGIAQAIAAVTGFLIAGVPGALILGFFTFFLSIIPAGPAVLWVGAAGWLLYEDRLGWAVFMALWGLFVISGIDNVVKPLLISRGASLPFVLVLLGVLGGVLAFGFVGVFLGPVLLAIAYNLIRDWAVAGAAEARLEAG